MTVDVEQAAAGDRVQAALDASCAALLALEQARDAIGAGGPGFEQTIEAELQAMELVRAAIRDLRRAARAEAPSALAFGFVRPSPDGPEPAITQS